MSVRAQETSAGHHLKIQVIKMCPFPFQTCQIFIPSYSITSTKTFKRFATALQCLSNVQIRKLDMIVNASNETSTNPSPFNRFSSIKKNTASNSTSSAWGNTPRNDSISFLLQITPQANSLMINVWHAAVPASSKDVRRG